jgi:hypothetical protein
MVVAYPLSNDPSSWELPVLKADAFVNHFDKLDLKALSETEEVRSTK